MPGVMPSLFFVPDGEDSLVLRVPEQFEAFDGERLDARLQQLARLTGKKLHFSYER